MGGGTRGAAAGLVAILLLSALTRVLPGVRPTQPFLRRPRQLPRAADEARTWQAHKQTGLEPGCVLWYGTSINEEK